MRNKLLAMAIALGLLGSASAMAQVPSAQPTYGVKQFYTSSTTGGPLANLNLTTLTGASTINSSDIVNFSGRGIWCSWFQLAHGGTPSVTMAIQGKTAAGEYATLGITAATTTTDGTTGVDQASVLIYPGGTLTTTPVGMVLNAIPAPGRFRVQLVIAGTGTPTVTGHVSCQTLP